MNTLGDQTNVQFSNIKTENNGGIPIKDSVFWNHKYKFNDTVATTYPDPSGNTTRPSRVWIGVGHKTGEFDNDIEEVWILSEPHIMLIPLFCCNRL